MKTIESIITSKPVFLHNFTDWNSVIYQFEPDKEVMLILMGGDLHRKIN